ncbi:MAG: GEVED domain-containing protein, partial [Thermoguttaceae bacterium]
GNQVKSETSEYASTGSRLFAHNAGKAWSVNTDRRLRVDFSTPVSAASIDFISNDVLDVGRLEAYDSWDNLLGTYLTADLGDGVVETMIVTRTTASIHYVIASGDAGHTGMLDNLVFGEPSTTTDADGRYSFTGLQPYTYAVAEVKPSDWKQTFPDNSFVVWDETDDGDLSNLRTAPTTLSVQSGGNQIAGAVGVGSEDDVFSIMVPLGMTLDSIKVLDHSSSTNTTYLAIDDSATYRSAFGDTSFSALDIGDDILRDLGTSNDNFTPPLPSGTYSFLLVESGNRESYRLQLNLSGAGGRTSHAVVLAPGDHVANLDFGNWRPPGGIRGTKFNDLDGDGTHDVGEPALSGWTLYLDENENGRLDATAIEPDDYDANEVLNTIVAEATLTAVGSEVSANTVHAATSGLASTGGNVLANDAGEVWSETRRLRIDFSTLVSMVSIDFIGDDYSDIGRLDVYDSDGNRLDAYLTESVGTGQSETMSLFLPTPEIAYAIARGYGGQTGLLDNLVFGEASTTTDENGEFWFEHLPTGTYMVTEVQQPGWEQTFPRTPGTRRIRLSHGRVYSGIDFGNWQPGEIQGSKWYDFDGDGDRDPPEPGLPGWTIYLDHNDNGSLEPVSTTTVVGTAGAIPDLNTATFTTLSAFGLAGPLVDVNVHLNISHPFSPHLDAFLVSPSGTRVELMSHVGSGASFINTVLDDEATTRIFDGSSPFTGSFQPEGMLSAFDGEDPNGTWILVISDLVPFSVGELTSWTLELTTGEQSTVTDADGNYRFTGLRPDTYLVAEVLQSEWLQTYPDDPGTHALVLAPGDIATDVDFGNAQVLDFGDAPAPYPTLLADDGARHLPTGPILGANWDVEINGQPTANADGDDTTGPVDDEDGVTLPVLTAQTTAATIASLDVDLQYADTVANYLDAWIDFNQDGDWNDWGEQIFTSHDLGTTDGVQSLAFTVPQDTGDNVVNGTTYARFRLSTAGGLLPTGLANDGEVEDYQVVVGTPAEVVGRHVFYNNSFFDGNDPMANAQDDQAIAFDKQALMPGETATFANYTSYTRGINGIMVDIARTADPGNLSAADFRFEVGSGLDGFSDGPAPLPITVRGDAGVDGSDRVTIIWPDNAIEKQWLKVTVKANERTGLAEPHVFYFGSAPGEAGDQAINTIVNATDEIAARNFQHSAADLALIDDPYDYNRDGLVNGTDQIIARENQTNLLTMLRLIATPVQDAELKASEPTTLSADLDWLYEFEQMNSKNSRQKRSSVEQAVDRLLAVEAV